MLNTNQRNGIVFEVVDSTVVVSAGAARIGNKVIPFQGGRISFNEMSDLTSNGAGKYQHSLLYVQNIALGSGVAEAVDMTTSRSSMGAIKDLIYPELPFSDTTTYSWTHPVGLFTFYSPDSTAINLINQYPV